MAGQVSIAVRGEESGLSLKAADMLDRVIRERTGIAPVRDGADGCRIALETGDAPGPEGFRITDGADGEIVVTGADGRGLLYGVGRFLRDSRLDAGDLTPSAWRGATSPAMPVRAMYFATHFHNFYHDAPVDRVRRYVEDMALWGCNTLCVWFDMHHYRGIDDPDAVEMIDRLHAILRAANGVGMGAAILGLANEAYAGSPEPLRADPFQAHYHVELCPHKDGAMELLMKWRRELFERFADIDMQYVISWPYDQGGCMCDDCAPWGANGFLKCSREFAAVVRDIWPDAKMVASTWCFSQEERGEYEGMDRAFRENPPDWLDYLMIDKHEGYPPWVLEHGRAPGGLPILTFPEISMFHSSPWGGWGANPAPQRFQDIWNSNRDLVDGGFPYSEGIYEDMNKALFWMLEWDPSRDAWDIVREYAAAECSPDVADDVVELVRILEGTPGCRLRAEAAAARDEGDADAVVYECAEHGRGAEAAALAEGIDAKLPEWAKTAWRWRILYVRAALDAELEASGGKPTDRSEALFEELTSIYAAEQAESRVAPPSLKALRRLREDADD